MAALIAKQIKLHLQAVPNWSKRTQTISRTFKFEGFLDSISFVRCIAAKAEKAQHHPDINIRWNKVTLLSPRTMRAGLPKKIFRWPGNAMKSSPNFLRHPELDLL